MTVNDINESLISAISQLAQKYDNDLKTTLTIEATITATLDSTTGVYTVSYLGSKFTAYANNPDITYVVDDKVYVLVPDGDFTKDKIILGYPTSSVDDETDSAEARLEDASGDILDFPNELSFCTYDKDNFSADTRTYTLTLTNPSLFNTTVQDYFDTYGVFKFACKVRTNIYAEADTTSRQVDGNYGIRLSIKYWPYEELDHTSATALTATAAIDITNILGNPYDQPVYSTQSVLISSIPEGATIATALSDCVTLEYFVGGFSQNLPEEDGYDENGVIKDDLFIKNITLKAENQLTTDQLKGYSLQLTGTNGNYLTTDASTYSYTDDAGTIYTISKDEYELLDDETKANYHTKYESTLIRPTLKKKGKTLQIGSNPTYWFKEDSSVSTTDNSYYSSYAGLGWKILNVVKDADAGTYVTSKQNYTAKLDATAADWEDTVTSSTTYKCVIVYDSQLISATITIKNLDATYSVSVVSTTGSNKVIAGSGTARLRCDILKKDGTKADASDYSYSWSRYSSSNAYIGSAGTTYEIAVPAIYITTMNRFVCTVYKGDTYIGSDEIYIITDSTIDYVLSLQNSDVMYKYDSDGDAPTSTKYDGTAGSIVTSISPFLLSIYRSDGIELVEEEYRRAVITWQLPVNSLMEFDETYTSTLNDAEDHYIYTMTGWEANQSGISYTLASSYSSSKDDNTIIMTFSFDNSTTTQSKTITFLKDGEDGTNGSAYSAVITYEGLSGKVLASDGTPHRLQVYTDGSSYKYISYTSNSLLDFYNESRASTDTAAVRKASRLVLNKQGGIDVSIYYNGTNITDEEDENYEIINWAIVNYNTGKSFITVGKEKVDDSYYYYLTPSSSFDGSSYCCVLQAKIRIGTKYYIYAYYPIDIIRVNSFTSPMIRYYYKYGFNSVKYAADGGSPKYSNGSYFDFYKCIDGTSTELELKRSIKGTDASYQTIPSSNTCLKINYTAIGTDDSDVDSSGNKNKYYTLKPDTSFSGESNNYCCFTIDDIKYYASIYCYYDTAGYSNTVIWDSTNITVDENAKIISSQVLSGVSGDDGFTGIAIGTVSSDSSDTSKNGLFAFRDGTQTVYISADTGAAYLGSENEITIDVPVPNTEDEVASTIAGFTLTSDRIYDNNGSSQIGGFYSADAAQVSVYQDTNGESSNSHTVLARAAQDDDKTIISYDGSFYTNRGNVGGWIIDGSKIYSANGSIILDAANNEITYKDVKMSDIISRIEALEAKSE